MASGSDSDNRGQSAMIEMRKSLALLAALMLPGLPACSGHGASDGAEAEHGYATGKVVDARGAPVAGAKILLDNSVFYASYIRGSSGEDGRYRIRVQPGAWTAHASLQREYNGKTYTLELHPDQVDSFDETGAVRNFSWKLEGRTPGDPYGYYGGFIQLSPDIGFDGDLDDVELTLVPSGPLIDGSEGKTLRLRRGDHYWVDRHQVEDVPIGRYLVTAQLRDGQATRPLRIQDWQARDPFATRFQLDFRPDSAGGTRNSASIVIGD